MDTRTTTDDHDGVQSYTSSLPGAQNTAEDNPLLSSSKQCKVKSLDVIASSAPEDKMHQIVKSFERRRKVAVDSSFGLHALRESASLELTDLTVDGLDELWNWNAVCYALTPVIAKQEFIKCLKLKNVHIAAGCFEGLVEAISKHPALEELVLQNCSLSAIRTAKILAGASQNLGMRKVKFEEQWGKVSLTEELVTALSTMQGITSVVGLGGTMHDIRWKTTVVAVLRKNMTILDLGCDKCPCFETERILNRNRLLLAMEAWSSRNERPSVVVWGCAIERLCNKLVEPSALFFFLQKEGSEYAHMLCMSASDGGKA